MKKLMGIVVALLASIVMVGAVQARVVGVNLTTILITERISEFDGGDFAELTGKMQDANFKYITVLINSPGGSGTSMLEIIKNIMDCQASGSHITTVNIGMAASAAGMIWLSGTSRKALFNSKFMYHRSVLHSQFGFVEWKDVPDMWKAELALLDVIMRKLVAKLTGSSEIADKFIGGDYGDENWFDVTEMRELGLIDKIL